MMKQKILSEGSPIDFPVKKTPNGTSCILADTCEKIHPGTTTIVHDGFTGKRKQSVASLPTSPVALFPINPGDYISYSLYEDGDIIMYTLFVNAVDSMVRCVTIDALYITNDSNPRS